MESNKTRQLSFKEMLTSNSTTNSGAIYKAISFDHSCLPGKAIVTSDNAKSLATISNCSSIKESETFTTVDKVNFIKALLNTDFFKYKYTFIGVCDLYDGAPFTTLQALGGMVVEALEADTLLDDSFPNKLSIEDHVFLSLP